MCLLLLVSGFPSCGPASSGSNSSLQPAGIDSLDIFNVEAGENILLGRTDSATYYADLALKRSRQIGHIDGLAQAFSNKSRIAKKFDGDNNVSEQMGDSALFYYNESFDKPQIQDLFYNLIWTELSKCDIQKAIQYSQAFYDGAKATNDQHAILKYLSAVSAINRKVGNYEESFSYATDMRKIATKENNKYWLAAGTIELARLYKLTGDDTLALGYFREVNSMNNSKALLNELSEGGLMNFQTEFAELYARLNKFDSAWQILKSLQPSNIVEAEMLRASAGAVNMEQGNFQEALEDFQVALNGSLRRNEVGEVVRAQLNISDANLKLNNLKEAIFIGRQGLALALQAKLKPFARDGFRTLSLAYDRLNRMDSSYYYFNQYSIYKDVVLNEQVRGRFAAYKYDEQIAVMEKDQQLERFTRRLLVVGIVALVLLAFFVVRNISLRKADELKRRKLAETELQIHRLDAEKSKEELLRQTSDLEMKALRAQMNPHFIFNCLNSINRFIINNDREIASDYLTKFSKLIRLVLEESNKSFVTLETELKWLRLYMDLEAIRFDFPFKYDIDIDGIDATEVLLPSLLIQPFVENAIWHGLHPKRNIDGEIRLKFRVENDMLNCEVSDNGIGKRENLQEEFGNPDKKSLGIEISRNRIKLVNPRRNDTADIVYLHPKKENGESAGTIVVLNIPIKIL